MVTIYGSPWAHPGSGSSIGIKKTGQDIAVEGGTQRKAGLKEKVEGE